MAYQDPDLIHPIPVSLRYRNKDNTKWDADSCEPVGNVVGDNSTGLVAQVSWRSLEIITDEQGGIERMDGYLLFRRKDLLALSVEVDEGDRILSIGSGDGLVVMTSWIWKIQRRGHYASQGGWTLLRAWFKDKRPVLQG